MFLLLKRGIGGGEQRGNVRRWLWVAISMAAMLMWALPALFPAPAAAATTAQCGTIQQCVTNAIGTSPGAGASVTPLGWFDPTSSIANVASGWFAQAQGMAQKLYMGLFVIELFMLGFQTILFRDNLGEFFAGLTFKVFVTGFFIWFITDAADIFTEIIGSFNQAGQMVSGASKSTLSTVYGMEGGAVTLFLAAMGAALVGASGAESICPATSEGCVWAIATVAWPLALVCAASALLVFSSLAVLSLTYILITIETLIVMCGGVFFLGFAGSRFTMPYSQGYLRYAINVGIKLFAFWLVVAVEGQLVPGVLANAGLVTGTTVVAAIGGEIAVVGTSAVTAANAGDAAKKEVIDAAKEAALTATVAAQQAAGIAGAAASTLALGNGVANAGAAAMAPADAEARDAEIVADMTSAVPADTASTEASTAAVAASRGGVAVAVAAGLAAVMFAAFGALQVIILNTLASIVPTLASSLTSGATMMSAQETLKGVAATFAEAGVAAGTLASKMNSFFSSKVYSPTKTIETMRRGQENELATEAILKPPGQRSGEEERALQMVAQRPSVQKEAQRLKAAGQATPQLFQDRLSELRQMRGGMSALPTSAGGSETSAPAPQPAFTDESQPFRPSVAQPGAQPSGVRPAVVPQGGGSASGGGVPGGSASGGGVPVGSASGGSASGGSASGGSASGGSASGGGVPGGGASGGGASGGGVPGGSASGGGASGGGVPGGGARGGAGTQSPGWQSPRNIQEEVAEIQLKSLKREEAEYYREQSQRYGLAGMTNAERDDLSPLKRANFLAKIAKGESAMTDDVKAWINKNPDAQRLWRGFHHKERTAQTGNSNQLKGLLFLEGLSATTHQERGGGAPPPLGDSGIKS